MFKVLNLPISKFNFYGKLFCVKHFRKYSSYEVLKPYIDPKNSYAFGRGTVPLINDSIKDLLDKLEAKPTNDFLYNYYENHHYDNKTFVNDVKELAASLHYDLNLKKNDFICLWSLNTLDWIKVKYSCLYLGAVLCTVNPYYKSLELIYALNKARPKILFLPGSESKQNVYNKFSDVFFSDQVQESIKNNHYLEHVVFLDEDNCDKNSSFKLHNLKDLKSKKKIDDAYLNSIQTEDPAIVMYTSGSTGSPKAALSTIHNVVNNTNTSSIYYDFNKNDLIALPLPLFHSFALVCGSFLTILRGCKMALTGPRFSSQDTIETIVKYNATHVLLTASMIIDILNYIEKNKIELKSLKYIVFGGSLLPLNVAHLVKKKLPHVTIVNGYGLSECGPVVSLTSKNDSDEKKLTTVGRPIAHVEIKIVDHVNGKIKKLNEVGEILVRGPNVFLGYFEDEKKTNEALDKTKWFSTGDLGIMDENGYLIISGRCKELIIKGGENIYPIDVENFLLTHPDISQVYVFGIPEERLGEEVCAWIKLKDPSKKITEKDIYDFCKDKITYFKIPKYVFFVENFIIGATNKPVKFKMAEETVKLLKARNENKDN